MKKFFLSGLLVLCAYIAHAQEQIRIWRGEENWRFTTSELEFSEGGSAFSVEGSIFEASTIDSIKVVHTVTVTYDGETATVDLGHAPGVTATVSEAAHVSIVSTNVQDELEFVLQGQSARGSLTYDGSLKCKFYLNGLNLTSDRGAAIDIQCGKRVDLILVDGTENVLADAAGGEQKAALYCKGHLEVGGGGSLTVTGNAKHAIATKEYLQLKRSTGTITVKKAVSDAMHVGQYFQMNGGTVNISGQAGDGIQVETLTVLDAVGTEVVNPDKENNGLTFVKGGSLTIAVTGDTAKGIKAPGDMFITGGTFNITASGDGSRGIQVAGNLTINEDDNKTLLQIRATGDIYEDPVTEDETRCMGIRIKGDFTITAGTVRVSNTGSGARGIKIGGKYTKAGTAVVSASIVTA